MVEVTYRDSWLVRAPVGDGDPEHAARRCLEWCVREAVINNRHR
jgi:hypothetical protein